MSEPDFLVSLRSAPLSRDALDNVMYVYPFAAVKLAQELGIEEPVRLDIEGKTLIVTVPNANMGMKQMKTWVEDLEKSEFLRLYPHQSCVVSHTTASQDIAVLLNVSSYQTEAYAQVEENHAEDNDFVITVFFGNIDTYGDDEEFRDYCIDWLIQAVRFFPSNSVTYPSLYRVERITHVCGLEDNEADVILQDRIYTRSYLPGQFIVLKDYRLHTFESSLTVWAKAEFGLEHFYSPHMLFMYEKYPMAMGMLGKVKDTEENRDILKLIFSPQTAMQVLEDRNLSQASIIAQMTALRYCNLSKVWNKFLSEMGSNEQFFLNWTWYDEGQRMDSALDFFKIASRIRHQSNRMVIVHEVTPDHYEELATFIPYLSEDLVLVTDRLSANHPLLADVEKVMTYSQLKTFARNHSYRYW